MFARVTPFLASTPAKIFTLSAKARPLKPASRSNEKIPEKNFPAPLDDTKSATKSVPVKA